MLTVNSGPVPRRSVIFIPLSITLESFKHKPDNWQELPIEEIPGWDLKSLFEESMGTNPTNFKQY